MFGFLDKVTPATARRLFDRAKKVEARYLDVPMATAMERLTADIPEGRRFVDSFGYEDLPDFSFAIMDLGKDPVLTIFGTGPFSGFMLQRLSSGEGWTVDVSKPAAFPIGPKAHRLAASFQRQYGRSNLKDLRRRLGL
jgi:hypothetical protein